MIMTHMTQDFSKKMTIVVRDDVASWQLTNTIGHIAAYLGKKMSEPFDTGKFFTSKDGINVPRNSQFAVVVLRASKDEIKDLAMKVRATSLLWIAYVQEMIDMIDDDELAKALSAIVSEDLNILGVGIFGAKDEIKTLTGNLKLWK